MVYIRLFGSLLHIWTYEERAMKVLAIAAFTNVLLPRKGV
jgi:hypothetical protein